jgi:hypothetical protein
MNRAAVFCLTTFLTVIGVATTAGADMSQAPDPETWYSQSYGPLWHDSSWDKLDEILAHYHSEIWAHPPDGEPELRQSGPWIRESMTEWRAEGWTHSEVPEIRVNHINDSTASFTTRWVDHYSNRDDDDSCAWYLADLIDGEWKFTQFAPIDCASHGF